EGGLIGDILIRMRAVNEDQVLRGLAVQMDIPFAAELPKTEEVDVALVERLPINFAKQHKLIPLARDGEDRVLVALADPLAVHALDDVRSLMALEPSPVLASPQKILDLINKVYAKLKTGAELAPERGEGEEFGDAEELVDILDLTDEAPIIRWVNSLMFQAVKERASDIHIEPGEKDVVVRYRIDDVLREPKRANRQVRPTVIAAVTIMAA